MKRERKRNAGRGREGKGGRERRRNEKTSLRGVLVRELITDITDTAPGHKFQNGEYRKHPVEAKWRAPAGFEMEELQMESFTMEYLRPKKIRNDRVILQLHGGGYIGPMKNIYRSFAVLYSKALGGGSVLTPDYRVAPEHMFPAALEDAAAAYEWLLKRYPAKKIILAGDSAGGGLALALCHYLKDKGKALPAGIIAMSPWADMTAGGESYQTNFEKDPLFGRTEDSILFAREYLGDADPQDPYASPVFGDFHGFPPVLLQVGSYEMLLSDSLQTAEKLRNAGAKVRCTVYEGMFHVFQMAKSALPESRAAWKEIRDFLQRKQ